MTTVCNCLLACDFALWGSWSSGVKWCVLQRCLCSVISLWGPDLHSSPLEKIVWVSDLCPIFIFPLVEGISISRFQAGAPLVVFLPIPFITNKVLYPLAPPSGIHNFIDVPLLGAMNQFTNAEGTSSHSTGSWNEKNRSIWAISIPCMISSFNPSSSSSSSLLVTFTKTVSCCGFPFHHLLAWIHKLFTLPHVFLEESSRNDAPAKATKMASFWLLPVLVDSW